jgi:hypothetical protein
MHLDGDSLTRIYSIKADVATTSNASYSPTPD